MVLEASHEVAEVLDTFQGHCVVHRYTNAGIEPVALDLDDALGCCLTDEGFLQFGVAIEHAEYHVYSTAVRVNRDL